jgi:thymidine phosphorylase
MNQGLNLAPAEGKMYKLRNEVACEDSLPIIASSLMSLKIATGSNKIVFDITSGKGTYISEVDEAKRLAKLLVRLGKNLDKEVACVITSMNQPLGYSIGHNLEMKETIMALRGIISEDLGNVVEALGSVMIALATDSKDLDANAKKIKEAIRTGAAFEKFKEMVAAQGGDTSYLDDPELFKRSKYIMPVLATESGTIEAIDADMVGSIAVYLGAGRMKKEGEINRTAGITINIKEESSTLPWEEVMKVTSTKNLVIIYFTPIRAFILPKKDIGGLFENLREMIENNTDCYKFVMK